MEPMGPISPTMTWGIFSCIGSVGSIGRVGSGRDCYGGRYGRQSKLARGIAPVVWRRVA